MELEKIEEEKAVEKAMREEVSRKELLEHYYKRARKEVDHYGTEVIQTLADMRDAQISALEIVIRTAIVSREKAEKAIGELKSMDFTPCLSKEEVTLIEPLLKRSIPQDPEFVKEKKARQKKAAKKLKKTKRKK